MNRKEMIMTNSVNKSSVNHIELNSVEDILTRKSYRDVESVFIVSSDIDIKNYSRTEILQSDIRKMNVSRLWFEDGLCLKVG
jgi:hypothetical protein